MTGDGLPALSAGPARRMPARQVWACCLLAVLGSQLLLLGALGRGLRVLPTAHMAYLWLRFGDALASIQVAWYRQFRNPLTVAAEGLASSDPTTLLATLLGLFGLVVLLARAARLSLGETLFGLANIVVPLCSSPMSIPRFVVARFILHLVLGAAASRSAPVRTLLVPALATMNGALMAAWRAGLGGFV